MVTWLAESFYLLFRTFVVLMIITSITVFLIWAWVSANQLLDEYLLRRNARKWQDDKWPDMNDFEEDLES